jgi:NitT/TauT family transport system substrate-binding protein
MKKLVLAVFGLALALGPILAGFASGGKEGAAAGGKLDKITLQLKWLPQSQFMGYYVAAAKGYYEKEGIKVDILPGGSDIIPEQQVYNGVADIGVTWVSSLLKYQEKGWGFEEVAQVFQKSAMLLVSKTATGIVSSKDLAGKKVGSWFGGNEYELYALIESAGLDRTKDLQLVQQDYTMDQVIKGDIDAASAMVYNEYGLLQEAGYDKGKLNVIDMNDAGVAMLEDCLFVNSKWLAKNEGLLVRFLRASFKGWADACKDPEAAGTLVYNVDKSVSLAHQIYMAKEVARLVVPAGVDPARIGAMNMTALQQTADYALKYGLLTKPADLKASINSAYWQKATAQ